MAGTGRRSPAGVLGVLVVLLVIIGGSAAGVVLLSGRLSSAAGPWVSPLSAIKKGAIDPAVALKSLAGVREQDVLAQALAAGSSDTALAVLLYSASLSDEERTSGLLKVAGRMVQAGEGSTALLALRTAALVAMLSPIMPDHGRAAVLNQVGQALAALGKTDEAARAYDGAATIALHSARLEPTYRRLLLEGLAADYAHIGRGERARDLRRAAQDDDPPGEATPYVLPTLLVSVSAGDGELWTELEETTTKRTELVAALIAAMEGSSPTPSETVRKALETTLVAEDRLRERLYSDGLAQTSNLMERIGYARAWMEWLALKRQVADQGFGVALVPAWERRHSDVVASLQKACEDYYLILRDVAVSLPDQLEAAQATVDAIADQVKLARLGIYPDAPEAELLSALERATRERVSLRNDNSLYVTVKEERGGQVFVLVSVADLVR